MAVQEIRFQSLRKRAQNKYTRGATPSVSAKDFFMVLDLRLTHRTVRENSAASSKLDYTMQKTIPPYLLREWYGHYRRIVENAVFKPSDTRTADALRLARKDLRRMEKYLPQKDDTISVS